MYQEVSGPQELRENVRKPMK